ncbi:NAD-dependent epimerase/dehydratase family protein [Microbacterium sp. NE2HP2]|uniref:NAD-dependent epimerase/dehydratase family protein n=1 Tax=Microbacterium plantarum TaxID=1816425 RepID=UPI00236509C6|nr:NAD-dependent epimerase/dehydratase family protein [Microbacterium plantarum]MDD7945089.1 NAD-dependent epimerase/dehydratase family protein [Microbacterium plantarum]
MVTGVAGFIGSTLAERLSSDGWDVVGIDNLSPYYSEDLKRRNVQLVAPVLSRFVEADLREADLDELLRDVDVVFHLAGQPGVRKSWGDSFSEYVDANVSATQALLEASRRANRPPRIVYASSSSVYGDAEAYPTREDLEPRPRSPYGVTKLAAEHLCRLYAANYGLPTVSLRFFTVYGPRQRPDMAFTRFLTAALHDEPISVYGTGEQTRDFTFVGDIVEALVRAGTKPVQAGAVYNVSGGGSFSVNQVLATIEELVSRPLTVQRGSAALGDVQRTSADTAAIARDLGWRATTDLRTGLELQLEWLRNGDSGVTP